MAVPTQPNHPATAKPGIPRRMKFLFIAGGIGLLLAIILFAVGFYLRRSQPAAETPVAPISAINFNGISLPVFPGAAQTSINTLMVNGASVDQVTQWYQTMLPTAGFTVQAVESGRLVAADPNGQVFDLLIQSPADGQVTIEVVGGGMPPASAGDPIITFTVGNLPLPAYPGSSLSTDPNLTVSPPGIMLVTPNTTPEMVIQWYQTMLPTAGYTIQQVAGQQITALAPDQQTLSVTIQPLADGQVSIAAFPLPPEALPPAVEAQPVEALPPPVEAQPVEALSPPAPAEGSLVEASSGLVVSVSPASIYAGTLNRLNYNLEITGHEAVTITVTIPAGVLVHPDDLAALGVDYRSDSRAFTWQPDMTTGYAALQFEAVNDLLTPPDSLVMKVVAQTESQQPTIQVATVEVEKY